jgi:hypothetical protein
MRIESVIGISKVTQVKGTEKQVLWANEIRAKFFTPKELKWAFGKTYEERAEWPQLFSGKSDAEIQQTIFEILVTAARETSADWWIKNRENIREGLLRMEQRGDWETENYLYFLGSDKETVEEIAAENLLRRSVLS